MQYFPETNVFSNYDQATNVLRNVLEKNDAMDIVQDTTDQMDIETLVQKPGIYDYFEWTLSEQPFKYETVTT